MKNPLHVNETKPFPVGSNNIFNAVSNAGNDLRAQQNSLAKLGGYKSKKRIKGGTGTAPVIEVPGMPSYAHAGSDDLTLGITGLAVKANNEAVFDAAKTPAQTNAIAASQQSVFKGGKKSKRKRKKSKKRRRKSRKRK